MATPNITIDRVIELRALFEAERAAAGLDNGTLPMRRDLSFGRDRSEAMQTFLMRAAERYQSYAANERGDYASPSAETVAPRLIHGTVDDCLADIRAITAVLPATTLIVRPHWPGMTDRDLLGYLAQLGEVIAALPAS